MSTRSRVGVGEAGPHSKEIYLFRLLFGVFVRFVPLVF